MAAGRSPRRVFSVGVLTPHAAVGPEAELPAMAPGRIVTRVARIPKTEALVKGGTSPVSPPALRALAKPPLLEEAAEALGIDSLDVIGYASTTSAYAIGFDDETALVARVSQRLGLPVATTCASAVLALRVLSAKRIALVHPPWFGEEFNELGAAYFRSQNFDVVMSSSADLPDDPRRIRPGAVVDWTARRVAEDADAVFIGGNGFRVATAIEALEAAIGRPVLESNQVLLWDILAKAGVTFRISGYGELFAHEPSQANP